VGESAEAGGVVTGANMAYGAKHDHGNEGDARHRRFHPRPRRRVRDLLAQDAEERLPTDAASRDSLRCGLVGIYGVISYIVS